MRRMVLILIVVFVFPILSYQALGGTSIVINSAIMVDESSFKLSGANFQAFGPVEIWIGDNCLTCPPEPKCPKIESGIIECYFSDTPAASGGTWTIRISAGNAPHMNEEIDIFIPTGVTAGCNVGDFVECYIGDPATNGVGECQSGIRTCVNGSWSECEGQVLPLPDEICGDTLDNDCDGETDEGCEGTPCDDGNACTQNDIYIGGVCQGVAIVCDDLNDCTEDFCDSNGGCVYQFANAGTLCGDPTDNECTNPDTCDGNGNCEQNHEAMGTACGSGLSEPDCNPDTCDGSGICVDMPNVADGTLCDDNGGTECEKGFCVDIDPPQN